MKTKKTLAIILTFILCFGVLTVAFADETAQVPEGYTPVYTAEDLNNIRNDLTGKYILMNDIDLSVYENWEPIGTAEAPFTGELDGDGNSVFNLSINGEYTDSGKLYFAMFTTMKNSVVSDLSIVNINVDVKFNGTSPKSFRVGALAGYANTSTIENCIASGNITLNGFYEGTAGGFFGKENASSLKQCVNHTDINIVSENIYEIYIGGIAGVTTNDTISECSNYGDFSVESIDSDNEARILKVGGIVGDNSNRGDISDCFNRGNMDINFCMPSIYVGGITGECCTVGNSYNVGAITVPSYFTAYIGGISGDFWQGGLAVLPVPNIENSYYINENLTPSYINGSSQHDYDFNNVKLLIEEAFKNQESFVGFDFENVWIMEENGYPVLRNQPALPERIPETPSTESTAESTTEPSTEPSTESTTEPSDNECPLANLWIVKIIKKLLNKIDFLILYIADLIVQTFGG